MTARTAMTDGKWEDYDEERLEALLFPTTDMLVASPDLLIKAATNFDELGFLEPALSDCKKYAQPRPKLVRLLSYPCSQKLT